MYAMHVQRSPFEFTPAFHTNNHLSKPGLFRILQVLGEPQQGPRRLQALQLPLFACIVHCAMAHDVLLNFVYTCCSVVKCIQVAPVTMMTPALPNALGDLQCGCEDLIWRVHWHTDGSIVPATCWTLMLSCNCSQLCDTKGREAVIGMARGIGGQILSESKST